MQPNFASGARDSQLHLSVAMAAVVHADHNWRVWLVPGKKITVLYKGWSGKPARTAPYVDLQMCRAEIWRHPQQKHLHLHDVSSNCWFRSSDLGVMSPARYPCAKLLYRASKMDNYLVPLHDLNDIGIVPLGPSSRPTFKYLHNHESSINLLSFGISKKGYRHFCG